MFDMIEQEKRREIEERRREEEYLRPGPCSRSSIQPRSRPHPQHMPSGAFTTLTSTAYTARLAVRKVSQKDSGPQLMEIQCEEAFLEGPDCLLRADQWWRGCLVPRNLRACCGL